LAPAQPEIAVRNPRPRKKAGTVSQLGILWVRKSTNAATNVTPMVNAQIASCTFIGKRMAAPNLVPRRRPKSVLDNQLR